MRNNIYFYIHPKTVWDTIKYEIELSIINGTYGVGDKVPSINEIHSTYNISKNTAVKVLESLISDEILSKKKGIGYFVLPNAKEKLIKRRKLEFKNNLINIVEVAKKIGYEKDELMTLINDNWG